MSRRQLIHGPAIAAATVQASAKPNSTFPGIEVNHVALRVTDVERSRNFYHTHLGMPVVRQTSSSCLLGLGKNFLALFKGERPPMDRYFIAIENYEANAVTKKLAAEGLNPDHPRESSRVYFRDPDGLVVQLSALDHHPERGRAPGNRLRRASQRLPRCAILGDLFYGRRLSRFAQLTALLATDQGRGEYPRRLSFAVLEPAGGSIRRRASSESTGPVSPKIGDSL